MTYHSEEWIKLLLENHPQPWGLPLLYDSNPKYYYLGQPTILAKGWDCKVHFTSINTYEGHMGYK